MRTLIQLAFTFFIAFAMISCGGDAKSSSNDATSKAQDNSTKPAATFKMKNDNKNDQAKKTTAEAPAKKAQNFGGSFSGKNGTQPEVAPTDSGELTDGQILSGVPSACALVSSKNIADIFGITEAEINQKDASHTRSPYTRSCFFRWEGASPNTGILVQVQANPVEEEYAEWVSLFVSSKRTTGEKAMGSDETFKYEKMEGLGDDGSYSHRLGKYVWRDGNKYAFMIAFNTNSAKDVQMKRAKAIGNIMMKNYNK